MTLLEELDLTDKQIVEKAVLRAIENGWKLRNDKPKSFKGYSLEEYNGEDSEVYEVQLHHRSGHLIEYSFTAFEELIFNHDFAKALWGNKRVVMDTRLFTVTGDTRLVSWEYHLMQMVISDEPIKYLGENI